MEALLTPHLTSFGSIVALPELEAAAQLPSSAEGPSVPHQTFSMQAFSREELQSLMLGASLFGARWGDIAQLVGSRTVSDGNAPDWHAMIVDEASPRESA